MSWQVAMAGRTEDSDASMDYLNKIKVYLSKHAKLDSKFLGPAVRNQILSTTKTVVSE